MPSSSSTRSSLTKFIKTPNTWLNPTHIVIAVQSAAKSLPPIDVYDSIVNDNVLALYIHVVEHVRTAVELAGDLQPEWSKDALQPILSNHSKHHNLSTIEEDAEYVLLVSTIVILAYEILCQRAGTLTEEDTEFIDAALSECLQEQEMLSNVSDVVEAEYERLRAVDNDLNLTALNEVWMLSAHISTVVVREASLSNESSARRRNISRKLLDNLPKNSNTITTKENGNASEMKNAIGDKPRTPQVEKTERSNTPCLVRDSDTKLKKENKPPNQVKILPSPVPVSQAPSPRGGTTIAPTMANINPYYARDVLLHVHIRDGHRFNFAFGSTVNFRRNLLALNGPEGICMLVEEGVTVSQPMGDLTTVLIEGTGPSGRLSGTIAIPPKRIYRVQDVFSFEYVDEGFVTGKITTDDAILYIGNISFSIQHDEEERQIVVINESF